MRSSRETSSLNSSLSGIIGLGCRAYYYPSTIGGVSKEEFALPIRRTACHAGLHPTARLLACVQHWNNGNTKGMISAFLRECETSLRVEGTFHTHPHPRTRDPM